MLECKGLPDLIDNDFLLLGSSTILGVTGVSGLGDSGGVGIFTGFGGFGLKNKGNWYILYLHNAYNCVSSTTFFFFALNAPS